MKEKINKQMFICSITLLLAVILTNCSQIIKTEPQLTGIQRSMYQRSQIQLSELEEKELLEFIVMNGIVIPPGYIDFPDFGAFVKCIVKEIEDDPDYPITYSNMVMFDFIDSIKNTVNAYYNVKPGSTPRSNYTLQYNLIMNKDGDWVDSGGWYWWDTTLNYLKCYAYAIGRTIDSHRPGGYSGNESGPPYPPIKKLAYLVKADLKALGYNVVHVSNDPLIIETLQAHQKLICIRRGAKDNFNPDFYGDFHFMKYNSDDGYWYHKPGPSVPLRYLHQAHYGGIWNNQTQEYEWNDECCLEGGEYKGTIIYSGDIWYIVYDQPLYNIGTGKKNDPYLIDTVWQLKNIHLIDRRHKHFRLADHLNPCNENWGPLAPLLGHFDGNRKFITGLYADQAVYDSNGIGRIGLWTANFGTIENLNVKGTVIAGHDTRAGMIAGINSGTIKNSQAIGKMNVWQAANNETYLGMISGWNKGKIDTCTVSYNGDYMIYSQAATSRIGGITGNNSANGLIQDCETNGDIYSISPNSGVIVGYNDGGILSGNSGTGKLYPFSGGGGGTYTNPYLISDKQHLQDIPLVDGKKIHFQLAKDINLQGISYNSLEPFLGILNGNGKIISNLSGSTLFEENHGTIMNLNVTGCINVSGGNSGLIIKTNYGTIKDCTTNSVQEGWDMFTLSQHYFSFLGGIAGYNLGIIKNCKNLGNFGGISHAGGIAGYNEGTITGCSNSGNIGSWKHAGGIAGYNDGGKITRSFNFGEIYSGSKAGGIVAYNDNGTVSYCYNTQDIYSSTVRLSKENRAEKKAKSRDNVYGGDYIGGIVGYNDQGTVKYSYNTSEILGWEYVGGIAGYNNGGEVSKTYNTADIYGWDSTGGIAGVNYSGEIINSYNTGSVNGYMSVGGLAGTNTNGGIVHFSYNSGNVDGYHNVGGIAGWYSGSSPSGGVVAKNLSLGSSLHSSLAGTRIYCGSGFFAGNKARSNMQVWINSILKTVFSNTYGNDGVEVLTGTSLWTVFQDFDTDVWLNPGGILEENYPLPTLRNMPSGVQNPVLK